MKAKVKKEGRKGVYLIEKEDAVKFVSSLKQKKIHNFITNSMMHLGADWNKKAVIDFIKRDTDRLAILVEPNITMGHHLVAITKGEERYSFDIGEITEKNLQIL